MRYDPSLDVKTPKPFARRTYEFGNGRTVVIDNVKSVLTTTIDDIEETERRIKCHLIGCASSKRRFNLNSIWSSVMGCGQKAAAEDAAELESALEKVGLRGDKRWGRTSQHNFHIEAAILKSAKDNLSRDDTIRAIHNALHAGQARADADEELKERKQFESLKSKY